ncbi:hypothetical protein Ddc_12057 [Ditylenchus destructor]|nr:hypothetical protein Ddc_12057 [Ditylenchus destructor]
MENNHVDEQPLPNNVRHPRNVSGNNPVPDDSLNISYTNSSSPSIQSVPDSSSESDYEKFGQDEIAEADARRLSEFGSQLAQEVLNQVTSIGDEIRLEDVSDVLTPNNESTSPLSNYMDERDLFVIPDAAAAEAHSRDHHAQQSQQGQHEESPVHQTYVHHELDDKVDEKPEEEDLLGFGDGLPQHQPRAQVHQDDSHPRTEELISFEDNQQEEKRETSPSEMETNRSHEMPQEHFQPEERSTSAQEENDQYSPSNESGQDTLSNLPGDYDGNRHSPKEEESSKGQIPESSSVTGMRDLDSEENTYERRGPLTIPAQAISGNQVSQNDNDIEEEFGAPKGVPRPPTPPKELSEPEEQKPLVMDLGPPHHPHSLVHRTSEKGLHSILRHPDHGPWIDFKHVDPRGSFVILII